MSVQQPPTSKKSDAAGKRLDLLKILWRSRLGDLREQSLIRQGKGWFHISGMGHEALAAFANEMEPDDYAFPYYRDRAFCIARGLSDDALALSFYAKRDSSSGGRQLAGHFSDRKLNIWSHPSPVGIHLLPACGAAWGIKLDGKPNVVYTSLGEASTRQGDFYESICFAKEHKLPIVFVVQDNHIAISTDTRKTNPLSLGALNFNDWIRIDGTDPDIVSKTATMAFAKARAGEGPSFIWCDVERFSNHSSADDQRMYRNQKELENILNRDPVKGFQDQLVDEGIISLSEAEHLEKQITDQVRLAYKEASAAADPRPEEASLHLKSEQLTEPLHPSPTLPGEHCRILDAVNTTFHHALDSKPEVVFFGEDIADPKGGVFNLTKGLSSKDPNRAVNAPLAESTILGLAVGLASYGKRPCFEIQFVDFIYPGWNQLVSNVSTLRWRSFGHWKCPLIIYAPCGGYLPGGALWHSQSAEGSFARLPGINLIVPSTPADAAALFWTAFHSEDPTIILLPKHLMWAEQVTPEHTPQIPFGLARTITEGDTLTLVTWGNCVELVEETLAEMPESLSVDFIDLRSIVPWDKDTIQKSVSKTGRILLVQEDNISGSIAQMIVSEICTDPSLLNKLKAPPAIISKDDVHIGFNPIYEYAALPDKARISKALEKLLSLTLASSLQTSLPAFNQSTKPDLMHTSASPTNSKTITVPILGEGIRTARVVSILKNLGESVCADDALCEVETDKAIFPIESDTDGVLETWNVEIDSEVSVGQDLATLKLSGDNESSQNIPDPLEHSKAFNIGELKGAALSPEVIHHLRDTIPATIEMTCRWEVLKNARLRSKESGNGTISTVAMTAWAVLQAIHKHTRFACVLRGGELRHIPDDFDIGVAVSRPDDELATAVVQGKNARCWETFQTEFNDSLKKTRHGESTSKNRVSISISSMTAQQVRSAIPIVVPPSISTLFIGAPYKSPDPESDTGNVIEVASLALTFDHRWVNGVGAASFLSEIRKQIENFNLV